ARTPARCDGGNEGRRRYGRCSARQRSGAEHRRHRGLITGDLSGNGHCHGGAMDDGLAKSVIDTEGEACARDVSPVSLAMLKSRAQVGIDAPEVTIEVFLSGGLPSSSIVGLAETAVRESKERVRGAILNSGFKFP